MHVLQHISVMMQVITVYTYTIYNRRRQSPPLTEVPTDIPADTTFVNLLDNTISSIEGQLDHIAQLENLKLNNMFYTFPNLSNIGSHLKLLYLKDNNMVEIPANHLPLMPKLTGIWLNGNSLDMSKIPEVEIVSVAYNRITHICSSQIQQLHQIKNLWLTGNPLRVFPDLTPIAMTLEVLGVAEVGLTVVPGHLIDPLISLHILYLNGNKLVEFPSTNILNIDTKLKKLALSGNPITSISQHEMEVLSFVKEVNVERTQIITLPEHRSITQTHFNLTGSRFAACACDNSWVKLPGCNVHICQ